MSSEQARTAFVGEAASLELRRLSRRSFTVGSIAAAAGFGGLAWVGTRRPEDDLAWPLRRVLEWNESVGGSFYDEARLAPTFELDRAREPKVNGRYGLSTIDQLDRWTLEVTTPNSALPARRLPLEAILALPKVEMVTELKCVEGWSQVVHWAGARFADFVAKFGVPAAYVGLSTPDRGYTVGLDFASAIHPQTLLCYEMNGAPLTPGHGAPLRLVATVKYGFKSIKQIGSIALTNERPKDYWAERGYDWYAGL